MKLLVIGLFFVAVVLMLCGVWQIARYQRIEVAIYGVVVLAIDMVLVTSWAVWHLVTS